MQEIPLKFINHEQSLSGILHLPEENAGKTGIVLLHGWATYRIGPHRLLVEAARAFTRQGFPCLRFDFRGRGESEGETGKITLIDMIDDAGCAVKVLQDKTGVEKIILLGLCSGGEVAVGASMSHDAVAGLILWSTPLLARQLIGESTGESRKKAHHAKTYLQKLFRQETLRKLITFRINFRLIFKILFGQPDYARDESGQEKELLEKFYSFPGKLLLVYGSNDPEGEISQQNYAAICQEHGIPAEFEIIAGANHNFYSLEWKNKLLKISRDWLRDFTDE